MPIPLLAAAGGFFKAIPWQVYVIGVAVVGFAIIANAYFDSQNKLILAAQNASLAKDATITELHEQVGALEIDKNTLLVSNQSLEFSISNLREALDRVINDTQSIIKSDADYDAKVATLEKVIADEVRNDRIKAIREGKKSELLLNYINKNVECFIANFDKYDGTCIQGVWRKNE